MAEKKLKQQTKRGLYWKFAEQFSNYGIQFVVGIFMARMLSPSDYGITALPAVFLAVAGIFAGAGFGSAMVRKPELKEEDLSTSFYYSTIVGIIAYIILFCASPWIANFYDTPVLKPLIRVTALGFIYGPMGTSQSIMPECFIDTTLVESLLYAKVNHKHSCNEVAKEMKYGKYKDAFAIGIIDNDKRQHLHPKRSENTEVMQDSATVTGSEQVEKCA